MFLSTAKEKSERRKVRSDVEAPPGLEPGVKVLQTSALPLGYGAVLQVYACEFLKKITKETHI